VEQGDTVVVEDQVRVGWRDVDHSGHRRLAVDGVVHGELTRSLEDLGQRAVGVRGEVEDHEDARGEVGRQLGDEATQRLDAPGRRAHDDGVMLGARGRRALGHGGFVGHGVLPVVFRFLPGTAPAGHRRGGVVSLLA
jgi:hypothetical protein